MSRRVTLSGTLTRQRHLSFIGGPYYRYGMTLSMAETDAAIGRLVAGHTVALSECHVAYTEVFDYCTRSVSLRIRRRAHALERSALAIST